MAARGAGGARAAGGRRGLVGVLGGAAAAGLVAGGVGGGRARAEGLTPEEISRLRAPAPPPPPPAEAAPAATPAEPAVAEAASGEVTAVGAAAVAPEPAPPAPAAPAPVAPTPAPSKCMGSPCPADVTDRVYLDLVLDGQPLGRVELGLFGGVAPKTVANFKGLVEGQSFGGYKGSKVHRVVPGFVIQGGDFTMGNGTGGRSIYGRNFPDENFDLKFFGKGTLAMANAGPNTNGSQFFICLGDTPWLDGKHVVFGSVLNGYDVCAAVEKAPQGFNGAPRGRLEIVDCGVMA